MPGLVLVERGQIDVLNALRVAWVGQRRVGLMTSPGPVQMFWTLAQIHPCTFSGYDGPRLLAAWSVPEIKGDRAVMRAGAVFWTYDGGPVRERVSGYYVIDGTGKLQWAQIPDNGFVAMTEPGQRIALQCEFSCGSRYPNP